LQEVELDINKAMYTVRTKPSTEYEAVETAPHFEE
jgi:hypothetical protein